MSPLLIHQIYAGFAPWALLSLVLIGRNPQPCLRRKIASLLLSSLILLMIPISGWNGAAWIRVLEPNPSFTLSGLLLVSLGARLSGKHLFHCGEWRTAWIFGATTSLILYPMGLGLTRIDPYAWGWDRSLPLSAALIATILLLRGNRFGAILVLPFAGWFWGLQESRNFWNALIDPFYGGISLLLCTWALISRCSRLTSPKGLID